MMTRLGDIEKINHNIRAAPVKAIRTLHKLIFEFDIVDRKNRKRLREFSGFTIQPDSDDSAAKRTFIYEEFDDADLIAVAYILSIDYAGPKKALAERIYQHLCNLDELKKNCSAPDEDDDDDELVRRKKGATGDAGSEQDRDTEYELDRVVKKEVKSINKKAKIKTMEHRKRVDKKSGGKHRRYNTSETSSYETASEEESSEDESSTEEEYCKQLRRTSRRRREKSLKFALTFRDLEDSIRTFSGRDGYSVVKWIDDFEETAELMEWDGMQKFIYAKKSLLGLAKLFIRGERGITTWTRLKKALKEEFRVETTAAEIHRLLAKRFRKRGESCQEYLLAMREIASRTDLDDNSLMQYVIDGLDDNSGTRIMLYGAKNLKEFKEKLRYYEQANEKCSQKSSKHEKHFEAPKTRDHQHFREARSPEDDVSERTLAITRCYNCGSKDGHKSSECKFKGKGPRCFKCNIFGHISTECTAKSAADDTKREVAVNVAASAMSSSKIKEISIDGFKVEALLDTGSHLNLVRDDIYENCGRPTLKSTDIVLTGFGKSKVLPRGYFAATVDVDEDSFLVDVYVVSADSLKQPAIIGNDLLDQAEVLMSKSGIRVKKVHEAATLMKIDVIREDDLNGDKSPTPQNNDDSDIQSVEKYLELKQAIEQKTKEMTLMKEELDTFKTEKTANEKIILEQSEKVRQELQEVMRQNTKLAAKCETSDEMIKILKSNADVHKSQIKRLEERIRIYSETNVKHEALHEYLNDQIMDAQAKLSKTEKEMAELQKENMLLRDSEGRVKSEHDCLLTEQQSHSTMLANRELIKATLERNDAESKMRLEDILKEAHRECATLRRWLQEEQDRFVKPWGDDNDSSGADEPQDGRMWEPDDHG